jgi:hypothetical protein
LLQKVGQSWFLRRTVVANSSACPAASTVPEKKSRLSSKSEEQ